MGTILFRLNQIDGRFERMERRFEMVQSDIKSLQYVHQDTYRDKVAAQDERIRTAVQLSMWALGLVCALVVGAIITAIIQVASA